ncbi:MAG: hypothetical protein U0359_37750 [Byssovorax sp.]
MIPPLDEVRAAHVFLARRFDLSRRLDEVAVAEALREADALAGGRIRDEPAALLFAFTKRPRKLGDAWQRLPLMLAENLARKADMELRLDVRDVELEELRLRVAVRSATFDDVRAWVAERLSHG